MRLVFGTRQYLTSTMPALHSKSHSPVVDYIKYGQEEWYRESGILFFPQVVQKALLECLSLCVTLYGVTRLSDASALKALRQMGARVVEML